MQQSRHRRYLRAGVTLILAASILQCAGEEAPEPAELVLVGGKIVTVDESNPQVQALAARGGIIVALGTDADIERYVGPDTETIDLAGRLAVPGFIEGHGHFMGIGDAKLILDLRQAANWNEIIDMVQDAVAEAQPGAWIRGHGWHQDKWSAPPEPAVEGFPVHAALSRVSPDNPVFLTHASGHASFVNARALALAGIVADTPDPQGGEVLHDERGQPTGLLREMAKGLVQRARDAGTAEQQETENRRRAELAAQECLRKGITSFQDAGSSFATVDFLRTLVDEGKMPLRLWVMIRASNEALAKNLAAYRTIGHGNHHLTVRGIKVSIDGALGSRGAWLLEPYDDEPQGSGLNLVPVVEIRRTVELAVEHDFQLCIHAVGDRANREVLDIYEASFAGQDGSARRWRIEHAQHLHPEDIPRFAELGVIASMQAIHCTSDAPWVPDRLGEKRTAAGAYVWQELLRSGAIVTNGTDAPMEDVSPIQSYYASVSRRLQDGSVFYSDQRLSRTEALRAYTLSAAYAAFEEDIKGSLEVGKLADITVLSEDILTMPEEQIPSTEVVYTIVGGSIEYQRR